MAHLALSLLGPFQATLDGEPGARFKSDKVRALLAYLAVESGRPHHRETLAGLLWPEWSDREALSNLRYTLSSLRQAIGDRGAIPPFLLITRDTLQFNTASDHWLDVTDFGAWLEDSGLSNGESKIESLESAIRLYRGSFLEGFSVADAAPFEEWVLLRREQLGRQMLAALHCLAAGYEQRGEQTQARLYAQRQVELEPWNEEAHQQLMRLLARGGQRSAALAQYETCRRLLAEELGVAPGRETTALYESIRDGTLLLATPTPRAGDEAPAPGEPPFRGLHYFDVADAEWFFGREELSARLVGHLAEHPFLAVVGASGSGKSSVLRAGLIPALQRSMASPAGGEPSAGALAWRVHLITPTAYPLAALATSLTQGVESVTAAATLMDDLARDPRALSLYAQRIQESRRDGNGTGRLLLVVDQFEELFTLCRDAAERQRFVDNLIAAVADGSTGPVALAIALRADFYAHCAQFAGLRQMLAQTQVYIGPMDRDELRRAIEGPAQHGGWTLEPGLVDMFLDDVGDEPGALPLLSHALLETWRRRRGQMLTLAGYVASGGVRGAIAQTAETTFESLTEEQKAIARRIFVRLTELGEGTQDTRRRAALAELIARPEEAPAVEAVLQRLADARLITTAENTVEVAHEALIREWPVLRQWLDLNRESLRLHRQITAAAREWQRLDRDPGALLRGLRLAQALEWARTGAGELNPFEQAFLDASQAQAEQETAEREAQRQRDLATAQKLATTERQRAEEQTRAARRLRWRAAFLAAALMIAVVLGITALGFARQARERAQIATARELVLAAQNSLSTDPERSIHLALHAAAAWSRAGQPIPYDLQDTLHQAVPASRARQTWSAGGEEILYAGFLPDGRPLVVTGNTQAETVTAWDLEANQVVGTLPGRVSRGTDVALSPDGRLLAVPGNDNTLRVWELASGREWRTLSGHRDEVLGAAFSSDGTLLATSGLTEQIVWDLASGERLLEIPAPASENDVVVFGPDGRQIATVAGSQTVVVTDIASGRTEHAQGLGYDVVSLAFSPDGSRVATGGRNFDVTVWDAASGEVVHSLPVGPAGQVEAIAYSPDGTRLATDKFVWDAATGQQLFALLGHTQGISRLAFSADGMRLITASHDGTVKVWDLTPSREIFRLTAHTGPVYDVAFSPDGTLLVTAGGDQRAILWDTASGQAVRTLAGHSEPVNSVAFSPDGELLATAGADRAVVIWEAGSGHPLRTLTGHAGDQPGTVPMVRGVVDVAFSPQCAAASGAPMAGCPLAAVGMDGQMIVWDALTGQQLLTYQEEVGGLKSLDWSPDGTLLVVGNTGEFNDPVGTATVLAAATGAVLRTLPGHAGWVWDVDWSPDGKLLATVDYWGTGKVWDAATGELLLSLQGPPSNFSVAFGPDGSRLATGSGGGAITLWNPTSGLPLFSLTGHAGPVSGLAFSPDGNTLASASFDGAAGVYAVHPETLLALARSRLTRPLTPEECQKYLHVQECPAVP